MSGSTFYRLGLLMARRRWVVVAVWAVLIVLGGGLASRFHDSLSTPSFSVTGSESERVTMLLESQFTQSFTEQDLIVFESDTLTVADPEFQAVIQDAIARVANVEGVVAVISPLEPGAERQISADGQAAYALVGLQGSVDDRLDRVEDYLDAAAAAETDDVRVLFTGRSPISNALVTVGTGGCLTGSTASCRTSRSPRPHRNWSRWQRQPTSAENADPPGQHPGDLVPDSQESSASCCASQPR